MLTLTAKDTVLASVIFLHGLGQTNSLWLPWVQQLAKELPHVNWILPQAEAGPVTINNHPNRPRWFDVHALPPGPQEEETPAAEISKQHIQGIIEDEIRGGIPSQKVFLVGFSQGSAMSLLSGLTSEHKLGGIGILAGWLPPKLRGIVTEARSASCPPLFWAHGTEDDAIPLENALETIQWLRSSLEVTKTGFTYREYPGLKHAVNDEVAHDLSTWLLGLL